MKRVADVSIAGNKYNTKSPATFIIIFLAPAFILFTAFVAFPASQALLYSLQKWNGITPPQWVGLQNFLQLLRDRELFLTALYHNAQLLFLGGIPVFTLSLLFAALLRHRARGSALFRTAFFFPNVLASVAVALIWVLLYSTSSFGIINAGLGGLDKVAPLHIALPYPFLDSNHLIYSLVPMIVWTATGFYMVLFLAAMEGIPEEYYEAAKLEGATGTQQFGHITLPLIREALVVGVIFFTISSLKFFDPIWVMENQRPNRNSHVLATLLYQKVFTEYNIGYGAAVAVLLFAIIFCATLISLRLTKAERVEF